jgi:hypothetical protein
MEIAWTAFLDELGEPPTPTWHGAPFCAGPCIQKGHEASDGTTVDEHWHIVFFCGGLSKVSDIAGRVWVDKQTGHCNVWINEDYEPPASHPTLPRGDSSR